MKRFHNVIWIFNQRSTNAKAYVYCSYLSLAIDITGTNNTTKQTYTQTCFVDLLPRVMLQRIRRERNKLNNYLSFASWNSAQGKEDCYCFSAPGSSYDRHNVVKSLVNDSHFKAYQTMNQWSLIFSDTGRSRHGLLEGSSYISNIRHRKIINVLVHSRSEDKSIFWCSFDFGLWSWELARPSHERDIRVT